jgi:hypothetical protein
MVIKINLLSIAEDIKFFVDEIHNYSDNIIKLESDFRIEGTRSDGRVIDLFIYS